MEIDGWMALCSGLGVGWLEWDKQGLSNASLKQKTKQNLII
jgi:hypothetical protein